MEKNENDATFFTPDERLDTSMLLMGQQINGQGRGVLKGHASFNWKSH